MKKLILYTLSSLFLLLILDTCKATKKDTQATYTVKNILSDYGEEVFRREQCGACHTQQIGQKNEALVSLDGLGGQILKPLVIQLF